MGMSNHDEAPTMGELVVLAQEVIDALRRAGQTMATAESCTGGLIGHLLTEVPGASDVFVGGAIVYSNAAKQAVLGVYEATLATLGAVSAPVATQMAQGARRLYGVNVAVSVTGIAGPGGSPGKPPGTTFLHASHANGYEKGLSALWTGDRTTNKLLSAQAALRMVLDSLHARALE
jgi:PncC family amidohydrolase